MNLTPKERERLTVFMAAELARRRKDRDVRLNHPEAVAYISDWCVERARDGWDVAEIRAEASQLLDPEDVMPGVPEMVDMIQVEPVFPDGTKLVTVHDPIRSSGAMDPGSDDSSSSESDSAGSENDAAGSESVADGGSASVIDDDPEGES